MSEGENTSPDVQEQHPDQPAAQETSQEVEQQEPPQAAESEQPEADTQPPEAQEPEASSGEKAAEGEAEGEKAEEDAVKTEEDVAEEDKKEESEEEAKEEEVEPKEEEEPIVITPEGSPFWLSTEDVLAKGLPESEVENFKNFSFKHAHSLQAFYEPLKDSTVPIEFVTLSKEEIDALTLEGEASEEQQQVLNALQERINAVIELYEQDGALIKVNGRSAKDSVLEKNEETFVQTIRDDVINSLEAEKQTCSAYYIWKDQEQQPGAFKRGITKLRASFRRSRTGSAGARTRRTKLEEEKKDDAPKDEEGKGEEPKPVEGEEAPPQEAGEGEAAAEVTVEVDVEATESDKPKDDEAPKEEAEAEAAASEEPKEDAATKEEEPKEEAAKEEAPKEEAAEAPNGEEGEKKEDEAKPTEEGEKKSDGEIQAAEGEGEEEKKEGKVRRKSTRNKKTAEEYQCKEAKNEPLDNQILRVFGRVVGSHYRVQDGKAALEQLRNSTQVKNDLNKLKAFGAVEGVQVSLSVYRWQGQIPEQTGMIFRGFVYKNELNALSQYNDTTYFPNVVHYKDTVISRKVQQFFQDSIKEALKDLENYIIDFFVAPDKVYVIRLNPFYTNVGACLFTWTEDSGVLTKGPFTFRVVNTPKTAPDAYSSYQSWWEEMLTSVLQQRKETPTRGATSSKCVIL